VVNLLESNDQSTPERQSNRSNREDQVSLSSLPLQLVHSIPTKLDNWSDRLDNWSDSDPDRLIHEYFLNSSAKRRIHLRSVISQLAKSKEAVIKILNLSRRGDIKDAYDAGVDLLAEFKSIEPHSEALDYLGSIARLTENLPSKTKEKIEDSLEILIQGIACAYKVDAGKRFEQIKKAAEFSQSRLIKAAVIDALVIIAEEISDVKQIKDYLIRYNPDNESDSYICACAQEAAEDLG
jgi:hypothetical protein